MDKNLDCSCTKKVHITKEKEHKPGKCPHTIIKKLVELMDNPMTKDQVERQVELLNDFMEATPYAFVSFFYTTKFIIMKKKGWMNILILAKLYLELKNLIFILI